MMRKRALVKGDIVDKVGKKTLVILLASIVLCNYYIPFSNTETKPLTDRVGTALICLSMVALALLGDRVKRCVRCIPMVVYTAKRTPWLLTYMARSTSISLILFYMIMTILPILICIKMMTICDDMGKENAVDSGSDIRYYLILTLLMDVMFSAPDIVLYGDAIGASGLFARSSILIASMILYLPRQGYLNIRRISITFGRFVTMGLLTFGTIRILSSRISAIDGTNYFAVTASVFVSIITLMCCMEPKKEPRIEADEYDYTLREKLLKSIGWCNAGEERANRKRYLESAAKRDFTYEYARRFYNDMHHAKDIASIQKKLRSINQQREALEGSLNGLDRIKASKLESEGADLLGKLCIAYDFNTGINACPRELLHTCLLDDND